MKQIEIIKKDSRARVRRRARAGEIMTSSCIQITDMQGKPCGSFSIKRPKDQIVFNTHSLKPGLYLCRLMNGGKTIKSVKLGLVR